MIFEVIKMAQDNIYIINLLCGITRLCHEI